jgi:hypothetical protein
MNLTEEQLKAIEMMASLFFSPEEIAINIEVDTDEFIELIVTKQGEAYNAYFKGWTNTEFELRKSILSSALNGSSPAQQLMKEYQNKARNE